MQTGPNIGNSSLTFSFLVIKSNATFAKWRWTLQYWIRCESFTSQGTLLLKCLASSVVQRRLALTQSNQYLNNIIAYKETEIKGEEKQKEAAEPLG